MTTEAGGQTAAMAWIWAGAQREELKQAFAGAEAAPLQLAAGRMCAALAPVANDSLTTVVVWGYASGALPLIAADAWLARKTYYWAVRPAEAKALIRDLDASGWMPSPPIRIHLCADHADLIEVFSTFGLHHGLVVLDPAPQVTEEIQRQRVRLGNRTFHGFERTLRDLHLLAERVRHPVEAIPMARLKGLHQGRAAFCVAAGPSLDRRLDFLRRHQHGGVVIAADLIAHKLELSGIRVDFVVSVDTADVIVKRCHPPLNPDAVVVMPLAADRRMDAIFPRRSFVWVEPTNSVLLDRATSDIPSGTNVGAAVLGLGIHMGCSELVLVGHDLSFTTERLYSDCVDQKQDLEANSLRAFRIRMQEVPGNGGGKVSTNTQFAMSAEDMATIILLHPALSVYNLNINDGSGALIRGAKALPEGWTPPAVPAPAPLPQEILPVLLQRSFAEEVAAQCDELLAIIEGGIAEGRPLLAACAAAWAESGRLAWACHLAEPMLGGIEPFCLNEMTRPMHEIQPELLEDAARLVRTYLPRWFALCRRALDQPVTRPRELDNRAKATFVEMFCAAPPPVRSSLQEILLPLYLSVWADFVEWMPESDPPLPARLAEAVTVVSRFGTQSPPASLHRVLAMCAVDASAPSLAIINQARTDLVLPADRLVADAARLERDDVMASAEAVLALREALPGIDVERTLRCALRQPFSRLPGIEAILQLAATDNHAAETVLSGLRGGWIRTDDATVAACIELHPDTATLLAVLAELGVATGERTRLAVARRYLAIGELASALDELTGIRPLSVLGVEARALACVCVHRLGRPELAVEILASLPAVDLASRVLFRYATLQQLPAEQAIGLLGGSGFDPIPPDVLAACLDLALEAGVEPAAVDQLRGMITRAMADGHEADRPAYDGISAAFDAWLALRQGRSGD